MNKFDQDLEEISKEWEDLENKIIDFANRCKGFLNK